MSIRFRQLGRGAVVILLLLEWGLANAGFAADDKDPHYRALLIGINDYQSPRMPDLRGALNDIELMRELLIQKFGFRRENIRTLTDSAATRSGILQALQQAITETTENDVLYVHYSGHGSQVADTSGDETDGKDETLVPHDGRTEGIPDVTDDEIHALLATSKAENVIIVLDSCHSGTATRGVEVTPRWVPPDDRSELYLSSASKIRERGIAFFEERHVLMTGARDTQSALDGPVDGRSHGLFSFSLHDALTKLPQSAAATEVMEAVHLGYRRIQNQLGLPSIPEPMLEGPTNGRLDEPLFRATGEKAMKTARVPWLPVVTAADGVVLQAGNGLPPSPTSAWAVYPPGEVNFAPGKAIACGIVSETGVDRASLRLLRVTDGWKDRSLNGCRAVCIETPSDSGTVPVRIESTSGKSRKQIEALLAEQIGGVRIVGPGRFARFVVRVEGNECDIRGADGIQSLATISLDDATLGRSLRRILGRSQYTNELLSLENPQSQLHLSARVMTEPEALERQATERGIVVVASGRPAPYRIRRPGEPRTTQNSLRLEVECDRDCYLTIVDVDPEGTVTMLFPNDVSNPSFYPEGRIPGGERIFIPDVLAEKNEAGFYWDYSEPVGEDTLRIFASSDLETATDIRDFVTQLAEQSRVVVASTRGFDGLQAARERIAAHATRGIIVVPSEPKPGLAPAAAHEVEPDWTAVTINIEISR